VRKRPQRAGQLLDALHELLHGLGQTAEVAHRSVSGRGHGPREDVDQRAGNLDADRADDDALDPLLGCERRMRLDGRDLPDEREDEGQGADRGDERLGDMRPGRNQVGNGCDVRPGD